MASTNTTTGPYENMKDTARIVTIYEYSILLHDALKQFADSNNEECPLMSLCVEMSLFVAAPNEALMKYNANMYFSALHTLFMPMIADLIISFVLDDGLKWVSFDDERYQKQINLTQNGHFVDFKNAVSDYVNVRTVALPMTGRIVINVFCGYKGDELWLGLYRVDQYGPEHNMGTNKDTLCYYGGAGTYRPMDNDPCHEWCGGQGVVEWSGCTHGSIHGKNENGIGAVIKHPIAAYVAGDWISFKIDFDAKTIGFYNNGQLVFTSNPSVFPMEQCYFAVELDDDGDVFYIEQGIPD